MLCPKCNNDNLPDAAFCSECGARIESGCPSCGLANPPGSKFCRRCGSRLSAGVAATGGLGVDPAVAQPSVTQIASPAAHGERRHLTVLFCDLVSSSQIAARLDPEEWRDIAAQYQRTAAEAVTRHGGHVAQYLGDGLVVYFGYPEAHEDDAERAVRAGLGIVEAMATLNDRIVAQHHIKLAVRVGIHAGSVVVGQGGGTEIGVFGEAPNVASRVQAAAEPDTVVITAAVNELVAGLFEVEDRGAHALKGIELPIQLYRALQSSAVRRRARHGGARALTPFVGREDELRLLLSRWERTREGEGQLVLVAGEPGIGKSRLVEEFCARIQPVHHLWIECAGEQFFENTPFHAVTQMLNRGLGWRGDESKEERLVQLERSLELVGMNPSETVPLIAELLNLPTAGKYPPLALAPDQMRKRLFAALAGWVFGATRTQPLVIAMEDLHWVDPSTLELTQTLVEQAATAPLMLLYTARPEFRAPWPMRAHHAQITLNRLNDRHTREMVAGVAARTALAKDVIDTVVTRTDGVPLFAEELTRLMVEGEGRSGAREIPATLHDSLAARLDRLGPAKEVAQIAAVIGREFSYELLQEVSPIPQDDLQSALAKLADAELIYARGTPPTATYRFKHALIQDAAYEALLKIKRREWHLRIARTIDEKFPVLKETHPEVLARHWTEAGNIEQAIAEWSRAMRAAESRNALSEAVKSCQQALVLFNWLPESGDRDLRELDFRQSLVRMLQVTRGYAALETMEACERAGALAEKSGNLKKLVSWVTSRGYAAFNSGDVTDAAALADQALGLALRDGSPSMLGFVYTLEVAARYSLGDLAGAEEHFAAGQAFFDAPGLKRFPGGSVYVFSIASCNAWTLGHPNIARERMARMMAAEANNPYDSVLAGFMGAIVYGMLGEHEKREAVAARALEISEKQQFLQLSAVCRSVLGGARARLGRTAEGIALIQQGIAGMHESGSRGAIGDSMTVLAEALADDGRIAEALETVEQALQANPVEICYRPETLRIRGELQLKAGNQELAESAFRESIALAQQMGAKGRELRAKTSLARLLAQQGKRNEARVMLAETYGWFTEGFDTADLRDARALLDELVP